MIKKLKTYTNLQLDTISQYKDYIDLSLNPKSVEKFISYLQSSPNIYMVGIGKNDPVAEKTANMLRSIGVTAHKLNPVHAMHGDMGMLKDEDLIICISRSGNTSEIVNFLSYLGTIKNTKIIGITGKTHSRFDSICDLVFSLPTTEIDEWDKIPTNSNIIFQLFLDSIIMSAFGDVIKLEDFIKTHPGGDIGKTKILKNDN